MREEYVMSSQNKVKLTKRVVESALPDPIKRVVLWDTEVTGFCVRIYPTGKKTYFLQYRNKKRETHKVKIGGEFSSKDRQESFLIMRESMMCC